MSSITRSRAPFAAGVGMIQRMPMMSVGTTPIGSGLPVKSVHRTVVGVGVAVIITGIDFVGSWQSDWAYWLAALALGMQRPGSVAAGGVAPPAGWAMIHVGAIVSFKVSTSNVSAPPCTVPETVNEIPRKAEAFTLLQLSK